jgi:hypothetical protein
MAIHQALGYLDCLGVVRAYQWLKPDEMPVYIDPVCPIFHHGLF